jgi:molybdopterin-synthase adenylyltransferase
MFETRRIYSASMTEGLHGAASHHLLRTDGQEDLCFGVWYPSTGHSRTTATLYDLFLPNEGGRHVHGNASFTGDYFARSLGICKAKGGGLAFLHSHPSVGWQAMSPADISAEASHAAASAAVTGLPLLGLTLGKDGSWSARLWFRVARGKYKPIWCDTVRVVGLGLRITYHPKQVRPYRLKQEFQGTTDIWGKEAQEHLGRINIGICGLGSVGSVVCEILARMGVRQITLIDFDKISPHNLDRTLGATRSDAKKRTFKTKVAARNARVSATADGFRTSGFEFSVVGPKGHSVALDCDLIFSCVDRPWPRRVLNHIAYAHLIPVIDGGIRVRRSGNKFKSATWATGTAGPLRACLECRGAYDPGLVAVEMDGYLEEPSYIERLPEGSPLRTNENVFPLSVTLAAHEVLQFVALVTGLVGMRDVGEQRFSYFPGIISVEHLECESNCPFPPLIGLGDRASDKIGAVTGVDRRGGGEAPSSAQ